MTLQKGVGPMNVVCPSCNKLAVEHNGIRFENERLIWECDTIEEIIKGGEKK